MSTIEDIERAKAAELVLVHVVIEALARRGPFYSTDVWRCWRERANVEPDLTKRRAVPLIQRVLSAMEAEGALRSRIVLPAEHGGGTMARRYYEGIE